MATTRKAVSRRDFLKNTGRVAAATTLVASMVPAVHAAENNTLQIALIGCGGRGTGAAENALGVSRCPTKLVAMADVFENRLSSSYHFLKRAFPKTVDVPRERQFIGFDAYRKAIDCLRPGDIAIFTTPLAFRWVHFTYAIEKGVHVFMEKPLTADGPTSRKMLELADRATEKNLKVGVGLMSRHSRALQQLADRIHGGEIGDLVLLRGYRMHAPGGSMRVFRKPDHVSEVAYQIQNFHSFLWASGGCFSDFYIHVIDHCCWMKDAWPTQAQGVGGRHYRHDPTGREYVDQNFDNYAVEYTFPDETKFIMEGRCMTGAVEIYRSFAHGTKGTAIVSNSGDCGAPSKTFKGLGFGKKNMIWQNNGAGSPYDNEWHDLVDAILDNKPYSEVKRGVQASLVTSMGRMAAHTAQIVTYDQFLIGDHEFSPASDKLTMEGPAPVMSDANGRYPVPQPGILKREYEIPRS